MAIAHSSRPSAFPTPGGVKMSGPLHGITVIDLTRVLAGPFCTMLLADMGAEVIKIERPEGGDDTRSFGPFLNGESAYFMSINRGKKSMKLNLKTPTGKKILLDLVKKADVVVENFKPGVMNKLGLGYSTLSKINQRLIFAASSGFGQTGPYSERPAYDLIIQGMSGMMSITGPDAKTPTRTGSSIADIVSGVFTVVGILSALYAREKTGRGQMVDVAMLDCMVAILENAITRFVVGGKNPEPIGNRHPSIAPFTTFPTADGSINIACGNDDLWKKFCNLTELEPLAEDPRFVTNPDRVKNWVALEPILQKAMRKRGTDEWLKHLQAGGIPSGPINKMEQVMQDPQVIAREMLVELTHPVGGPVRIPGFPIKFSENPVKLEVPAPTLGQHTTEILSKVLGLSTKAIEELRGQKVI